MPSSKPTISERKPVALIILDGWGLAPPSEGNAVALADTPVFDTLLATKPNGKLTTHGHDVGLPEGQMGNSEVGHLNLGAGFIVRQELTRIHEAVDSGAIADNVVLGALMGRVRERGGRLHLIGLLGDGGVHAHQRHLAALLHMASAQGLQQVAVHGLTDGRDTAPESADRFVPALEAALREAGVGRIASLGGRYFGMDRDHRWPRVERAWRAIVDGQGQTAPDSAAALAHARAQGLTDEFLPPTVIDAPRTADEGTQATVASNPSALTAESQSGIQPEDGIVLFNFRADRMRQLLTALTSSEFDGFERRGYPAGGYDVVTMTRYLDGQSAPVAFPPFDVEWPLARVVAEAGRRQFHAAETEKYAHVTYFINGGGETPFAGEERCMIPSPDVATYDLRPQMSAEALTEALVQRIREGSPTQGGARDDLIVVNYANPDMVGHTGSIPAAVQAVETVDTCLGRLLEALRVVGGIAFVTADHGNAEQMIDPETGGPHTAHTTNPVAYIVVGLDGPVTSTPLADGRLADVAPTLLALLGLKAPPSMTGRVMLPPQMLPSVHPVTRTEPSLDGI